MKIKSQKVKIIIAAIIFLAITYIGRNDFFGPNSYKFINQENNPQGGESPQNNSNQEQENKSFPISALTGKHCENANRRTIAVMLSSDEEARPLSGIAGADMVFEMPVVEGGATRLMAIFGCDLPSEIGSVRSARHDFIPLAKGLGAIYAHWGGSHFALDKLKTGVIDNLDALVNPYSVFFRKKEIPAPHNGFTSGELLLNASEKLGYRLENKFSGYPHEEIPNTPEGVATRPYGAGKYQIPKPDGKLTIGYPGEFRVEYKYDSSANSYLRWRGGTKEIDKNTGEQVSTKNVVVMYAESRVLEGQYNNVDIVGQGNAEFYFNGGKIEGVWKKSTESAKLYFLDNSGAEIKFAPGNIWVEIIRPELKVEWVKE